ncbi:hypothetical protein C1646_771744 [Rhizophagus diaphanus]|nr:hypothetical protein C1646_771744 [Rhizophagus diaphanus] [Rhizophagus sp. MUCL 43196]
MSGRFVVYLIKLLAQEAERKGEFCKVNIIIDIKDKRDFYNVYLDSLRKYKTKTNIYKLKKKQANFLYEIAEKLLEDFEVQVSKSDIHLFWAKVAWANEGLLTLINFEHFESSDNATILLKIIQSSKSIKELDEYLSLIKSIAEKQKITIIENSTLNIKKDAINYFQVIDTYNGSQIWEVLLGNGQFSKIACVSNVPSLEDTDFYNSFQSILDLFDEEASNFNDSIHNGVDNLLCEDFNLIELKSSKTILTKWLFNWKNPPKQFSESNYLFNFLLLPLDLFFNDLLIYLNFEKSEHPTYGSMERKNNLHRQPFEMLYGEIDENTVLNSLKNISKSVTKKVDAAISYSPFESEDGDVKLYFFLCEAKKPNTPDELEIKDYDKLVRLLHDCFNSLLIYYSKMAKFIIKTLRELFYKILLYGLHIHDGKATLIQYDLYCEIGRIRKVKEVIIPIESEKKEAPYIIEMLWIIKKLIKETYCVVQDIEREIKTIRNNSETSESICAIEFLSNIITQTTHTPKKK